MYPVSLCTLRSPAAGDLDAGSVVDGGDEGGLVDGTAVDGVGNGDDGTGVGDGELEGLVSTGAASPALSNRHVALFQSVTFTENIQACLKPTPRNALQALIRACIRLGHPDDGDGTVQQGVPGLHCE
jgi:hypothetical protein